MSALDETETKIVAYAKLGYPPRLICHQVPGLSLRDVQRIVTKARAAGIVIDRFRQRPGGRGGGSISVTLGTKTMVDLAPFARRRGRTVNELVRAIVNAILADNLIDAVLDDADECKDKRDMGLGSE